MFASLGESCGLGRGRIVKAFHKSTLGFTLIEVLVVIVIVSVLAGLTVLSIAPGSPQRTLKREAQRLELTVLAAAEKALLDGLEYGLRFTGKEYQIVKFDARAEQWIPQQAPEFQPHRLPDAVQLVLEIEEQLFTPETDTGADTEARRQQGGREADAEPHILLLSSGEVTAFDIYFSLDSGGETYHLASDGIQVARLEKLYDFVPDAG